MIPTLAESKVIADWTIMICKRAGEVDQGNELDWRALFIGFAIGRGLSVERATDYMFYMDHAFPKETEGVKS